MQSIRNLLNQPGRSPTTWLLITIVLGGFGSGLWEFALKPSFVWLKDGLLFVSTLGVDAFRDSLYARVANGFHEYSSLQTYNLVTGILAGGMLGLATSNRLTRRLWRKPTQDSNASEDTRALLARLRFVLVLMIFFSAFFFIQSIRVSFVVNATTHIQRLVTITAPHLTQEDRLLLNSRIAQIRSRADFIQIESELQGVVTNKKLYAPKFSIW